MFDESNPYAYNDTYEEEYPWHTVNVSIYPYGFKDVSEMFG